MESENKFATLNTVGVFISAIGWLVVFGGVIAGIIMIQKNILLYGIFTILGAILGGFSTVAQGQIMQCLVVIEFNTRSTAQKNNMQQLVAIGNNTRKSSAVEKKYAENSSREKVLNDWESLKSSDKEYLRTLSISFRNDLTIAD